MKNENIKTNGKKLYNVHFMGYCCYDVSVLAENEEEAERVADPIFAKADLSELGFEWEGTDTWKARPDEGEIAYTEDEETEETVEIKYKNGKWV